MCSRSLITFALILGGLGAATPSVEAQGIGAEATMAQYNAERKEEFAAAGLEVILPVLGHAYANDAGRGVLPALVSVGGLVVAFAGGSELNTGMMTLGWLGYFGGRVWGVVSALDTARDHNTALRQRLNLSASAGPRPGLLELRLSVSTR